MILKSAALSGLATVSAYWPCVVIGDIITQDLAEITILAVVVATPLLWVIGFAISLFFLLILYPLYNHISRAFSLVIFSLIGFLLPAYSEFEMRMSPTHGYPALFERDPIKASILVLTVGIVGLSTAITAWYTLGKHKKVEPVN